MWLGVVAGAHLLQALGEAIDSAILAPRPLRSAEFSERFLPLVSSVSRLYHRTRPELECTKHTEVRASCVLLFCLGTLNSGHILDIRILGGPKPTYKLANQSRRPLQDISSTNDVRVSGSGHLDHRSKRLIVRIHRRYLLEGTMVRTRGGRWSHLYRSTPLHRLRRPPDQQSRHVLFGPVW